MTERATVANTLPEVALLWDYENNGDLTPDKVSPGSGKKIAWKCREYSDHVWVASVANQKKKPRCPYCAGTKTLAGFNDLATVYPEVAAEWHPTKNGDKSPVGLSIKNPYKAWWVCDQGHEWQALVFNRTAGRGCPVCNGRVVNPGVSDLATVRPDLVAEWHPTKNEQSPSQVAAFSHSKAWWVCKKDSRHEWEAAVGSRAKEGGNGCPICANYIVVKGINDLATCNPELAAQWHPTKNGDLTPADVHPGSKESVWWVCPGDSRHEWQAPVERRARSARRSGCPVCAGKVVIPGLNDLGSLRPDMIDSWHPTKNESLTPADSTVSSRVKVWWQCPEGHAWYAEIRNRTMHNTGCPYCANKKVEPGFNDLATHYPHLTYEWDYDKNEVLPSEVTPGSGVRVWWRCLENAEHSWQTTCAERTRTREPGCPQCRSALVTSRAETEISDILESLGVNVVMNSRKLLKGTRQELDLYLPDYQMAIEFNGLYWHSEVFKDRHYHANKLALCQQAGISLFQVWEDDWRDRKSIVIRSILHRIGMTSKLSEVLPDAPSLHSQRIGARETGITPVTTERATRFLLENHIQGSISTGRYLGLQDREGRLRALLAVTHRGSGEYRIERYATAGTVVGGFTKLLRAAEAAFGVTRWVTFADLSVSDGALYEQAGFTAEATLPPDYSYIVNWSRVHKFNYRLKRFREDPSLIWQEGLTEKELAELNGLHRVWDSGKVRYVKNVER